MPASQPTGELRYYPLDTFTKIPEIDVIIRAVASGDPQLLRDLFEYMTIACMTANALGGPPPCRQNEAEGTVVEMFYPTQTLPEDVTEFVLEPVSK